MAERPAAPHEPHAAQQHPGRAHVVEAVRGGGTAGLRALLLPAEGEVTEVEAGAGGRCAASAVAGHTLSLSALSLELSTGLRLI